MKTTNFAKSNELGPRSLVGRVRGFLTPERIIAGAWMGVVAVATVHPAFASGGMDTSTETWNNIQTWLNTWIPLMCAVGVIVVGIGWGVLHVIPPSKGWTAILGMMIAGSASYLVSLTGIGSS